MGNSKINVLSVDTVGKIAAGEVVERPASVVKELVENSIDAGSDSVEIEIQKAGQTLIRVADNGEGMTTEDAQLSCQQHATSKIQTAEDLDKINTLGFRGEALSSIAAVSQMDIVTQTKSDEAGVSVHLESGEPLRIRPAGRTRGTTVEVRNLFYNVPARRSFLKKESTELAEIVSVVGRFIVSYPGIEFKLTHDAKRILHSTRDMDMIEKICLVLGADVSGSMIEVSNSTANCNVSGFVSGPASTRKDRRAQMFFVNGRFVRSKILSDALYTAYRSLLERGRYPSAVIFIKISSGEVDVNVHPAKLEVKFENGEIIRNSIIDAIKESFEDIKKTEKMSDPIVNIETEEEVVVTAQAPTLLENPEHQTEFSYADDNKDALSRPPQARSLASFDSTAVRSSEDEKIFQVGGCYIVQVKFDAITITDQHAAHERVLYELFSNAAESSPPEVQNMLFPVRLELSSAESLIMNRMLGSFGKLGFDIEHFGEGSFIVQAVPAILRDRDIKTVIYDILTDLASCNLSKIEPIDEIVKLASCRAAIKAGDALNITEMIVLLEQLNRCSLPFTCPHGRPTILDITVDELEKRFRRK